MGKRTAIQKDANLLDLEIFNLAMRVERFSDTHGHKGAKNVARELYALRHCIRKEMHEDDIAATV